MKKRILSILLLVSMLATMLPTTAFAAEDADQDISEVCTLDTACVAEVHQEGCPMAEELQTPAPDEPEQSGLTETRRPGSDGEVLEGSSEHIHVTLEGDLTYRIFNGEYSSPDPTKQYKLRMDLPPNYTVDEHALGDGGTKTIMTLPEDTPYFGAAEYERLEWDVKNADGNVLKNLYILPPMNEMGYDFEVLSKAMIEAGADADQIPLPYVISLLDEDGEVVETITLETTSDLGPYCDPDNAPFCEEEEIEKVYSWFSGSTGYIDMMYSRRTSTPKDEGWLVYSPFHYPVTNLRSYVPYDDDRRLTPVMRDGEARYIGDQEIDGMLYAVFQWSDFWTYPGVGKLSKYNIFYSGPLADMGKLSYQMPEDYKPGETYTFSDRQIKFGYTELAEEYIVDHIKLPERYTVPNYKPIDFHMTDTVEPGAPVVDETAMAQGFENLMAYQLNNDSETLPTRSYQDVIYQLDFSAMAEGIDGTPVQTLQPTGFSSLDTRGLKEVTYTLSNGETRTMDLMQISRNFDIPEGQHVTGVKVWYEQIDRSTVSSFQLKLFHPMLKETRGKVSHGVHVTANGETIAGGENKIVYHDSVQGPDVLRVYPQSPNHPAAKQSILADGKAGLDGCADNTSYNQIIRFIKYKNRHMRNYENARLDLELDPHPLSKLQGIELTKDLYAGIGTVVDKVELHYTTNKHPEEQVASTIVDRNETTAFDGVSHHGHMAILLDLEEGEYVTSASVHLGTIYGENMTVSAQGQYAKPEAAIKYGFAMLFDMEREYHNDPNTQLGSAENSEPMKTEGVDAWKTKVSFHSDSTERDEQNDRDLTSYGHTYFGDRVTYRISNDRGSYYPGGQPNGDIQITFIDEDGKAIQNNSGQISVPHHMTALVEDLVFWEDYVTHNGWSASPAGDDNQFVDRNMWGEPSRRLPQTGVTMDGYLYLQVNRDFEISNVVINPNATADYETSVPTLVKKIAIGPEATQEGFRVHSFGPNYDPLDLESVLYIYKIEGNRTPVNHISMDVYASERAKPREGWNESYPDEANRNTKVILKTAVSYNEAFSEWEAEGSSAKQQGAVLGAVSWTDDIVGSFKPTALDPSLRNLNGIPACDAQEANDKVFHEYGFVNWSSGYDFKQNYGLIPGLILARQTSGHLDSMGAKAAADDLADAESVTEYGKTVRFVRDEAGKLLLAVKLTRPEGMTGYTQIRFSLELPRAGETLTVNGKEYQSDFSVYLDPTRFENHLGRYTYKTNKHGDKIPPKSGYDIEVTSAKADDGTPLGTGELNQIKNPETIKTLTTKKYALQGLVGGYGDPTVTWDEYLMFYFPVTVEFPDDPNVRETADTQLRPSAYVGFESAVGDATQFTPHVPVELRYENAYDIRVISGYDKNENGLDDEQYYSDPQSPTFAIQVFDQNDQLLATPEPVYDKKSRTYSLTVPDTAAYLKLKDVQYRDKELVPSIMPDFDSPAGNRLTAEWTIPITDADKASKNLIYHALFIAPPSITAEDVTLSIAESKALPLEVNAASGYHLSYELADPTIASIDRALKQVTGQRAGTTTYTVTVTNPSGLQTSASAQITVTMPTIEVTGTKTWVDYDDMYGLRPDSVQFQLYDGDTAVGEPVNISADDNWEHTWTVPKYDDASREIYYTVKEIGSYPNYTSKPTPDGRGVINTLDSDVLIGSVTVSKTTAGGDGTFTFRLVGPGNTHYEGVVGANGTIDKWTHNNTGMVVEKLPAGTYTLYEFPTDGYYLDSITATAGAAESINGGQALRFTISESNPTVRVSAKNVAANGGSITVTHEIKQGDLGDPDDQFTFVLKNGTSEEARITLSANGTYTFHDLKVGSSYSVTQILEDGYTDYVVSVLNSKTDPGKVDSEKKQYTFTPTADNLSGKVVFRNVNTADPTDPPEPDVPESALVTFQVVNGTWADCSSADQTVEIALTNGHGTLDPAQVPTGMKPDAGYEGGAWDVTPDTSENAITEDVTYVYTFRPADPDVSESAVVTFRVVNGTWADCSSADQTVEIALTDGHGTLASTQVPTGMKPDAGYEGGAWDVTPDTAENAITEDVTYVYTFTKKGTDESGGGGGAVYYTLRYDSNGGTQYKDERYRKNTVVELDKVPARGSYTFTGWYADKELTEPIDEIQMTSDKTVYAGWRLTGVPDMLNGDEHFAYVAGYEDGTVRPNNKITRAEVATIFYRLLDEDVRSANETNVNPFADVEEGMWFNTPVSTVASLGIVEGRPTGVFDPNAPITRAEFATVCAQFDRSEIDKTFHFSDTHGHWAESFIERAASLGWISGYEDGAFRPENYITRAEAMTMINRVLKRLPETEDDLIPGMKRWPDNQPDAWYYLAVQEATNGHEFERRGEIHEHWTKLTTPL